MNFEAAETVLRAVLYEGYVLYPYRSSATKNQGRWMFGTLAPAGALEKSAMRTECIVRGGPSAFVDARAHFLQNVAVTGFATSAAREAVERTVCLGEVKLEGLCRDERVTAFEFGGPATTEGGKTAYAPTISGVLRARADALGNHAYKLRVDIENTTAGAAADCTAVSFASTHVLLGVKEGEFCSLSDPPEDLALHAATCRNVGTWPALLAPDTVLSSPIILPDFPAIAEESPGDLFDSTEIDEILSLRIMTLTDAEKDEVRRDGGKARALLDRTEALSQAELARLHGVLRVLQTTPRGFRPGDRVRLLPRRRADLFDIVLKGRSATVVSLEEDFEGQTYVTVTVDDDPGQDLGRQGQPGHRFFFRSDEVEQWI